MRHTLLPLEERKNLKREYYVRLAIVVCCMVSLLFVAGSILLLPAYLQARLEERDQLKALAQLRGDKNRKTDSVIADELYRDSTMLLALENSLLEERPSEAIKRIIDLRVDVHLTSISYSVSETIDNTEIIVQGTAPTRGALLSFKERVVGMAPNVSVDLPLSELAKSSSIPFSLKIIYPNL